MVNLIQQPAPYDLVGNPILVGGIGQGFEATLQYRVHDGHDERTGFFNVGGGTGEHGQYQLAVDVAGAAFQLDRLFVEVYEESAQDGSEINKVTVPVIYGPRIVPGLYRLPDPRRQAGRHAVDDREGELRDFRRVPEYRAGQPAGDQRPQPDLRRSGAEDSDRRIGSRARPPPGIVDDRMRSRLPDYPARSAFADGRILATTAARKAVLSPKFNSPETAAIVPKTRIVLAKRHDRRNRAWCR